MIECSDGRSAEHYLSRSDTTQHSAEHYLSQSDTTQRLFRNKFAKQSLGCNELTSKIDPSILRQYNLPVSSFASILRRYDKKVFLTRPDSPSMQCRRHCFRQRHFLGVNLTPTLCFIIKKERPFVERRIPAVSTPIQTIWPQSTV